MHRRIVRNLTLTLLVAAAPFAIACDPDSGDESSEGEDGGDGDGDCTVTVEASDDAQDAVQLAFIEAEEGDVICLGAGTFRGFQTEITMSVDDVTIQGAGMEDTVLDFATQESGGNGILLTGDNVTIQDMTVKNTPGDGIRASMVDNITFRRIFSTWEDPDRSKHGAYALYPVGCSGVLIEDSVASESRDAGIYVGQSTNIVVRNSEAFDNVAGIEIENSDDAEVYDNYAHDNTGGFLVFDLPGLEKADGARTKAYDNQFVNNNTENFAKPGTVVEAVPPGTGVLLLANNLADIHDNDISDNNGAAVLMVHCHPALLGAGCEDPNYDPFPKGNYIHHNTLDNNGTDPNQFSIDLLAGVWTPADGPAPELVWDGGVEGCPTATLDDIPVEDHNCFFENTANGAPARYANFDLCGSFASPSTEMGVLNCEGMTLPKTGD